MARAVLVEEQIEDQVDELDVTDTVTELEEEPQEIEEAPQLPDKYRDKSLEDLVHMHQEAEKMIGRHSSEVGELRSVVDNFITTQTAQQQQPPQQEDDTEDVDFFTDPQKAVSRAIENHPKIRQAEEHAMQQQREALKTRFSQEHPDAKAIMGDAAFIDWIKGSEYRTQMFVDADKNYNFAAANELFSLWKERTSMAQQTAEVDKKARKSSSKAAQTGSGRSAQTGSRKKIYRRADIIKLMVDDPDRYASLNDEIMQAYSEGHVK